MKMSKTKLNIFSVLAATGSVLLAAALLLNIGSVITVLDDTEFVSSAYAASDADNSAKGAHGANKGGQGIKGGGSGQMGKKGISKVLESDSGETDSDRPAWAGGAKELNPHSGGGNPAPGTTKGDDFGDLWVVVRNPVTGEPILVDGELQVCLDVACTSVVLTVDGELPAGAVPAEVELGRSNIVRSPTKVTDHALDELLTKLSVPGVKVTVDEAGRLVIDGATVDSPLENLAFYIALMTDSLDPKIVAQLPNDVELLMLAASALAAGSDKTGTITIDSVVYLNMLMGITTSSTFYDYGTFDYDRATTYSDSITYYVADPVTGVITSVTSTIYEAVFGSVPYTPADGSGVSDFQQAADDALQVIEFIHTEVH